MENSLTSAFNEIINNENVIGCVLTNPQGLGMLWSPNLKPEVAGLASAISQHAAKLENGEPPIITLEGDNKICIILNEGGYTTAIFKKNTSQS